MFRTAVTLACILACTSAQTVPELNVTRYLGRWYQVYGDVSIEVFESRYCVTADYGLNSNGTVSVWNRERTGSVQGPEKQIQGWASVPNPSEPGKLEVHLQGTGGPGPYWVYQLGPATYRGSQYQYSIVSDGLKASLFVLARNVTEFKVKYESDVLQTLKDLNFNKFYDRPLKTYQEGCRYWN